LIYSKRKKQEGLHNLNIATIFSYGANEDDADANGFINFEEDFDNVDLNELQNQNQNTKSTNTVEIN
jgi:type I restriction enzyme R subunit